MSADYNFPFVEDRFILVEETRSIGQIVADLKGVIVEEPEMCPFCPIFESPEVVPQPIGNDFYGETASILGVACCPYCKIVIDMMSPDDQAWYVAQVQEVQQ